MKIAQLFQIIALVTLFSSLGVYAAEDQTKQTTVNNAVQIGLDKIGENDLKPFVIYPDGSKKALTLGNFVSGFLDLTATKNSKQPIDPNALFQIKISKNAKNEYTAHLFDMKGREEELNLGNFLAAAAENYSSCSADDLNGREVNLKLRFEKDAKGNLNTYIIGPKGKEIFNLGVMLREVSLEMNKCEKTKSQGGVR